jgi:chitinase
MRRQSKRLAVVLAGCVALAVALPLGATATAGTSNASTDRPQDGRALRQVAYFIQWGIYGRSFFVKNVDTSGAAAKLTHLNYAFGGVGPDANGDIVCQSVDPWADYQRPVGAAESVDGVADADTATLRGNFGQLRKLKAKYPKLKVLMSLGGWTLSKYFPDGALTDQSRRTLVQSCVDLFIKGNLDSGAGAGAGVFDGFDLDWEWPGSDGNAGNIIRPEDKANFTLLLAEFRRQLDAYGRTTRGGYQLSAFLPAAPAKIAAGFEGNRIFDSLDYATLQGYDFHGTWETVTNHQSAIRVPAGEPVPNDFSIDGAVNAWVAAGAPRNKLVLGIPYYGQGWTGVSGGGRGLFQPATGPAPATFAAGTEDYKALAPLTRQGFTVYRDLLAGHAWLFDGTTFWTFDDPIVVLQKTLYIRTRGLGGAMAWELSGDDANATLTKTISLGLNAPR